MEIFKRVNNNDYRSWYDLDRNTASKLEREFISNDMGKDANRAMHICIIIGILSFVIPTVMIDVMIINGGINIYSFLILFLIVILGMIIVVGSTIEYHIKFNSWLKVKHRIIKK